MFAGGHVELSSSLSDDILKMSHIYRFLLPPLTVIVMIDLENLGSLVDTGEIEVICFDEQVLVREYTIVTNITCLKPSIRQLLTSMCAIQISARLRLVLSKGILLRA